MEMPNVRHELRDSKRNILFVIWAYSQLSNDEVQYIVRLFLSSNKVKKNSTYEIPWMEGVR